MVDLLANISCNYSYQQSRVLLVPIDWLLIYMCEAVVLLIGEVLGINTK
jgi:hypothetical protein